MDTYARPDFTERWVVTTDWTYTANLAPFLNSTTGMSNNSRHLLVFYGLDTVANIVGGSSFALNHH
jgi:beta-mannosidase